MKLTVVPLVPLSSGQVRATVACLLALASGAVPAASHIVEVAWATDGRFAHAATVEAGKFVELCGKLNAGDSIRWSFDASAPLDFNIHYHVGKAAEYPAKQAQARSGQDTLRVSVAEDYCWMWSNKSANKVKLDVRLQR